MLDNSRLFEYCLNHHDLHDEYYYKGGGLIISKSPSQPNELMNANERLRELITSYKIASEGADKLLTGQIELEIQKILKINGIHFSEFVAYWKLLDSSFSIYQKLSTQEQIAFIREQLRRFIQDRHGVYAKFGYSQVTLQVMADTIAHKKTGRLGAKRIQGILEKAGFHHGEKGNQYYLLPDDKRDTPAFNKLLKEHRIELSAGQLRQGKLPDALFFKEDRFYIVEQKHIKKGGGGQNSYLDELISFIRQSDKNTSYIAYLDGPYFSFLSKPVDSPRRLGKIATQRLQILEALQKYPDNYFLNTNGFRKLIEDI